MAFIEKLALSLKISIKIISKKFILPNLLPVHFRPHIVLQQRVLDGQLAFSLQFLKFLHLLARIFLIATLGPFSQPGS